ncbi:chemotaxis protein CheD [Schlegelella sp. S2-27]|uniref:Probable chemoreceptor glutamine deamidase CheD n=1 Tax=Caldimonas mangrovi TaxID=2944811 RepID=A0ABT0YMI2_9BURK|nr:chemotaxis protein CheD [Caldimonas mangrovi]MCM5679932.1 chemotaxis protein CheD [Caldimonas mangrovi]
MGAVDLQPGQYFVGDARQRVRTILGSCVSITLWHARYRVGAMSHFLLPHRAAVQQGGPLDARYGQDALRLMLQRLLSEYGVSPRECEAKVFGGGDMFPLRELDGGNSVGRRNGEAAQQMLLAHGITVRSESLFGKGYRQIYFDIGSGDVWVRLATPPGARDTRPGGMP